MLFSELRKDKYKDNNSIKLVKAQINTVSHTVTEYSRTEITCGVTVLINLNTENFLFLVKVIRMRVKILMERVKMIQD